MQVPHKLKLKEFFLITSALFFFLFLASAQVNTVQFGKNRLQFKNMKWKYYQTPNFNTYFNQNGDPLAKYVCQVAEKELARNRTTGGIWHAAQSQYCFVQQF